MTRQPQLDSAIPDWLPTVSGNAELTLSMKSGSRPALQLDFDFKGGGGFVVARHVLSRPMPKEYAVNFFLRGRGPVNNLELKLIDDTGQNVWRYVMKDLAPPSRWKRMRVESRDIDFAWGPSSGGTLSQLGSIEFAIVAGAGGKGTMWLADVTIEDRSPAHAPALTASSALPDFSAEQALLDTGWKPLPSDLRPWITIDLIERRTLGGLIIDWLSKAPTSGFRVRGSNNGRRWKTLHLATRAGGKRSYVYLPGLTTRFLRLELMEASAGAALRLEPFEFSRSIHAFWHNIADAEPRGWHPRWLHREQSVWTPIGTSNGTQCALINDDGMVEVAEGSFSIEPMVWIDGRLVTWTDVTLRQELEDDWMPVPCVIWEAAEWRLAVQAEATPSGELRVRYRLVSLTDRELHARLFVLVRPFQVTPPWQSFRKLGGVSPIYDLAWVDAAIRVNQTMLIVPATEPSGFGAMCFDDGFISTPLLSGTLPRYAQAHDASGFATGALEFDLPLRAHQTIERLLSCVPLAAANSIGGPAFDWSARLPLKQWAGSGWITQAIHPALTATAHILVTRSGPALQPGPRRYTRSWIRDGAMMSAALLRMGHVDEVREYIRWYAPKQRADGFVPCCVDADGVVDWLVEHDSHGELLALIADYYRFTADHQLLRECWIFVERAVGCIERLLDQTGLLPISASHEGYLSQPVHSYWDDFWALKGLRDAVRLARALEHETSALQWETLCTRFAHSLFVSIEATRAQRKLDYIPGSIEWADFDPTATANALYLLDVPDGLDRKAVDRTFDAYFADWRAKRSGAIAWTNYTPYEIRIIGAFVRLGRRDAALELLRFFLSDRRPPPWNQWPEIAWRDHKAPAHVGDLPHTWISAEYVLAVRSLFAYERDTDQSLVLAAGLAPEWIEGEGVQVSEMPTLYGKLSYSLRRLDSKTVRFAIESALPATLILRPPLDAPLGSVTVNGAACTSFDGESVTIRHAPAEVTCITS